MSTLTLNAGARIGDYEILDLLGRGGFGAVYRARDSAGGLVALKLIRPEADTTDAEAERIRRRVEREIKAMSRVRSTAVVQLYRWGVHAGLFWLAMEYVEGATLSTVLQAGPLAPGRAVRLAMQMLEGLAAAHDEGIVHRDLKPDNVIIQPRRLGGEDVKILDFGVARLRRRRADTFETADGDKVFGTPAYMAPEQGRGQVSPAADLYALGTILHEMLLGVRPYGAESALEVMVAKMRDPLPPFLRQAGLPAGLVAACEAALAREPTHRPGSAAALFGLLQPFATLDLPPIRFSGPVTLRGERTTSNLRGELAVPPEPPPSRRPLLIVGGVVVLLVGTLIGYTVLGDEPPVPYRPARSLSLPADAPTGAPRTVAPKSAAPLSFAPVVVESAAPMTAAPATAAPETAAPATAAPPTAAPVTAGPATAATAAPAPRRVRRPKRPAPRKRSSITDF